MNKKLIILGIALVIIIAGITMTFTLGFNKGLEYGNYARLNIYMNKESNIDDVKQIISEVLNRNFEIEYTDEFRDTITIKTKEMTDDELNIIKTKLQDKYEYEENADFIMLIRVPTMKMFDLIKVYIKPIVISFVVALVFLGISFRKAGIYKSIIEPALTVGIIGAVYASIIVICRIPINEYIIPVGILIYIVSLLGVTVNLINKNRIISTEK